MLKEKHDIREDTKYRHRMCQGNGRRELGMDKAENGGDESVENLGETKASNEGRGRDEGGRQ